ncbi:dipeptidase [Sphingosinicella microcystinivorans]|uniref:dipeptidase n=1 Tax=Sphingosinicella microcystinivorans TaxID=335406 RepID=UPI0022F3C5C0|nr:membrane dipeptidase [Sphingosinicella microcystinivorans]WBX85984.1 membrane dipeptidase [Sphingosinicella microcystinivorans]
MAALPGVSRRQLLGGAVAAAAVTGFPMINTGMFRAHAAATKAYSKRAIDLVKQSLVIDMLAPLKIDFRPEYYASPLSEKDAADFRASGITGFHNAVGTGGPEAYSQTLAWIAAWQGFAGRNAHVFSLVGKAEDLDRAKREGKCAVIMGVQNSEHFRKPEDVKMFYEIGQRCSQLTYNAQNLLGSGSTERVDGGVTDFGAAIIEAMNKVGMLVDVSHCGDRTTLDAIAISPRPIAITHSNCRALVDHPRVKTDEAIKALGAKGGVMGITGVRMFVSEKEPTTISNMVDHIDHVVKLIGVDHVGIGSDADLNGYDDMPADQYKMLKAGYKESYAFRDKIDTDGFDHPMKTYDLAEELIRRKYSNENITAILGGNFRRLLGATWA